MYTQQIIKIFLEHSSHFKEATVYRTVSFILFFRTRQEPGLLSRVSVWQEGKKENKTKAGIERCFLPKKRISLSNIRPRGAELICQWFTDKVMLHSSRITIKSQLTNYYTDLHSNTCHFLNWVSYYLQIPVKM